MRKIKLVRGVGENDADYQIATTETISGRRKVTWVCPIYQSWASMLQRCYDAAYQAKRKTYVGCTTVSEWLRFSAFRAWVLTQDYEGKTLDKDILITGNKVYSPGTCVFVPGNLNGFMTDSGSSRGEWSIGVSRDRRTGAFMARCCNPFTGKNEYLGLFDCPDAAHEAWRAKKHEHACTYADQQTDHRIAEALRTRYSSTKKEYSQ